jgi:glycosyl transferase family 25
MKVIVINLDTEVPRWVVTRERFRRVGLEPVRVSAIPGESLSALQREALYSERLNRRQYHKPLRPGEIGCYASHLSVWSQLVASRDACVAVFEDDVTPDDRLPEVLRGLERGDAPGDMVKLVGRPQEKLRAREPLLPGTELVRYARVPSLTGGYVIRRSGAQKLLTHRLPFGRPVDVDLRHWWECGLEVCGVQPYPVRARSASRSSTIDGRQVLQPDARMRLHKLLLQLRYTLCNWHACHLAQGRTAALARPPRAVAAEGPAGHDFA